MFMRLRYQLILIACVSVMLTMCHRNTTAFDAHDAVHRYITPQPGNGIALVNRPLQQIDRQVVVTPQVALPDNYVISHVVSRNLDNDQPIEQIVLFKNPTDINVIQVSIIDYDRQRNSYIRAWEGFTSATNTANVRLEYIDLTRDGKEELLLFGLDSTGQQTLDVFIVEFFSLESVITLRHAAIFQSYSVIGIENRQSYIREYSDIQLPTIIVEENIATENSSILQRSYQWSPIMREFIESQFIINENVQIDELFHQYLVEATANELLKHIDGTWVDNNGDENAIMIINTNKKVLELYRDRRQSSYIWDSHFKTQRAGFIAIHLTLANYNFSTLLSRASITITSADRLTLIIDGPEYIESNLQREEIDYLSSPPIFLNNEISVSGWFRGVDVDGEIAYFFNEPHVIVDSNNIRQRGSFVISHIENPQMEISLFDDQYQIVSSKTYRITLEQNINDDQIENRLFLRPIHLHVNGAREVSEASLELRQEFSAEAGIN